MRPSNCSTSIAPPVGEKVRPLRLVAINSSSSTSVVSSRSRPRAESIRRCFPADPAFQTNRSARQRDQLNRDASPRYVALESRIPSSPRTNSARRAGCGRSQFRDEFSPSSAAMSRGRFHGCRGNNTHWLRPRFIQASYVAAWLSMRTSFSEQRSSAFSRRDLDLLPLSYHLGPPRAAAAPASGARLRSPFPPPSIAPMIASKTTAPSSRHLGFAPLHVKLSRAAHLGC